MRLRRAFTGPLQGQGTSRTAARPQRPMSVGPITNERRCQANEMPHVDKHEMATVLWNRGLVSRVVFGEVLRLFRGVCGQAWPCIAAFLDPAWQRRLFLLNFSVCDMAEQQFTSQPLEIACCSDCLLTAFERSRHRIYQTAKYRKICSVTEPPGYGSRVW